MSHFNRYFVRTYPFFLFIAMILLSLAARSMNMDEMAPHYHYQFGLNMEILRDIQSKPVVFIAAVLVVIITMFLLIYLEYLNIIWRIILFTLLISAFIICAQMTVSWITNTEISTTWLNPR
ncbi:MAG: hypothetical protein ACRC5A_16670 [Enterobacteriaceae bacterium]